jgi:putative ABC transport system permease protein
LTVGVLYVAMAVGIGLGSVIIATVGDVRNWYRQTLVGDFFLRAAFPNRATGQTLVVDSGLTRQIRAIPGVTNVDTVRFFNSLSAGHPVFVVARQYNGDDLAIDLYHAEAADVRKRLRQGEVVVGTVFAQRAGVKPGDELAIETRHGVRKFRVAALAIDYLAGGDILFISYAVAQPLFDLEGVNSFLIRARPDALAQVRAALEQVARRHRLMLHSFAELSVILDQMMGGVIAGLWGILALGFVVAAFGIANTLTMNVLEQTRELALLRVVAMTRRQVRRLVLAQAGIIGLLGLALGAVAGLSTAYAMSRSMTVLLGHPTEFAFYPWLILGGIGLGMALVLAAALLPARRAARLDLLIALQYE